LSDRVVIVPERNANRHAGWSLANLSRRFVRDDVLYLTRWHSSATIRSGASVVRMSAFFADDSSEYATMVRVLSGRWKLTL